MIKRTVVAATLGALGITAVLAQGDPIAARKALMKGNNDNAKIAVQMMRGETSYDQAKVDAAFAQWAETAQKLPGLFPDNSKTGENTRATPKVWETKADFDAKSAAFGKAVAEYRGKTKNIDELKIAMAAVGKTCDSCHEQYRARSQR